MNAELDALHRIRDAVADLPPEDRAELLQLVGAKMFGLRTSLVPENPVETPCGESNPPGRKPGTH